MVPLGTGASRLCRKPAPRQRTAAPRDLTSRSARRRWSILRKHCREKARQDEAWRAFVRAAQRQRLMRFMQRGPLDPGDVIRLMRGLRPGRKGGRDAGRFGTHGGPMTSASARPFLSLSFGRTPMHRRACTFRGSPWQAASPACARRRTGRCRRRHDRQPVRVFAHGAAPPGNSKSPPRGYGCNRGGTLRSKRARGPRHSIRGSGAFGAVSSADYGTEFGSKTLTGSMLAIRSSPALTALNGTEFAEHGLYTRFLRLP